ncbi:MAG: hypothetical protein KKB65_01735 [Nanoarchaeota archaeon]|nr:hypothetical protein [Nanoarchaeota archaeon]
MAVKRKIGNVFIIAYDLFGKKVFSSKITSFNFNCLRYLAIRDKISIDKVLSRLILFNKKFETKSKVSEVSK